VLVDGVLPEPLALDDWSDKLLVGQIVRGVVIAVERGAATVRVGTHEARLRPADVAWTGRTALTEVFKQGDIAPFTIAALPAEDGSGELKLTLEQDPAVEGALLALDVKTGAVRAMVGGYDYGRSKFNRATQARRQAGSTFKPFVYAAAIEARGYTPATTILDAPLVFPARAGAPAWAPRNYDGSFWGPIPLRRALENSRNIPAIRTLQAIGVETGIAYARKLGLQGELPPYLPIAIGAGEASLSEMVSAFAAFANQGLRMEPWFVTRITDRDDNVIEENRPRGSEGLRADTAYIMASLLRGVVERGTATRARALGRPIGGKTGTTDDFTDGWFIGFEPGLAAGVWVGFDDKRKSLGRGQDGARSALPIWIDFWKQAMADMPIEEYPVPGNILLVPVDAAGRLGRPGAEGVRLEPFVAGSEPGARRAVDAAE
jgi:penicillin-binding protein 1A